MSTFGKKALVFWDYDSNETNRFSKTPIEIQLQILEKWYPIGWRCKFFSPTYLSHIEYEFVLDLEIKELLILIKWD